VIWDRGTFETASDDPEGDLDRGKLSFALRGAKLEGGFTLVRFKKGQWLLIKQADKLAERGWKIASALTPARRRKLRS
jgi:bifunctional non-homologous end joining protein LigD